MHHNRCDEPSARPGAPAPATAPAEAADVADAAALVGRNTRRRAQLLLTAAVMFVTGLFARHVTQLGGGPRRLTPPSELAAEMRAAQRDGLLRDFLGDTLADDALWFAHRRRIDARQALQAPSNAQASAPGVGPKAGATAKVVADARYERVYGSAARYARATQTSLQLSAAASTAGPAAPEALGRGTLLRARLAGEVASAPLGGTAVAVLLTAAKVGTQLLPAGTQVHGSVSGASTADSRLSIAFHFARLASGQTLSLEAVATDLQGRGGLVGKRQLTRASAGSVGLAAATQAGQAATQALMGGLGAIVGAGMQGAMSSSQDKILRLDQDDDVVVVAQGTPLRIYVHRCAAALE